MTGWFVAVFAVCLVAGFALSFTGWALSAQRRAYWTLAVLAGAAGVASTAPTFHDAALLGAAGPAVMLLIAFAYTPYLKIGGRVRALTLGSSLAESDDPDADRAAITDAYNRTLSAGSMWLCVTVVAAIGAGNVYHYAFGGGSARIALAAAAFALALTFATAVLDGGGGHRVARGQYVWFGIATVLTAGVFAFAYLPVYAVARRGHRAVGDRSLGTGHRQ